MIHSGIFPCILIIASLVLTIEAKSVENIRTKRTPGIQHPRLGRRSEETPVYLNKRVLQHPRLGGKRSAPSLEDINLDQIDPELREQFLRIFMELVSDMADSRRREELMRNFFSYPRQGRATKEKKALEGEIFWGKRSSNSQNQNSVVKRHDDDSFLHYPRMGRRASWEGIDDLADDDSLMCCSEGIKVAYMLNEEPVVYCKVDRCCDGLVEKSFFKKSGKTQLALVSECSEPQDMAFGSSRASSDS